MLSRQQALDEARKQKAALATIAKWRRNLFILTACFMVVAVYMLTTGGHRIVGILSAVVAVICLLLTFVVNLSIRNGNRNVERILDSLDASKKTDGAAKLPK